MVKYILAACLYLFGQGNALAMDLSLEPLQPLHKLDVNQKKVALGKALFFEARLSHDNSISCAHCHELDNLGGTDGLKHSRGVDGREGMVNAPTVFNAALNLAQFWDGRAATLEAQMDGPVHAHAEMASDWPEIVSKLKNDPGYVQKFKPLYPNGINEYNIKDAIAEFERSLITTDSRFDRYLQGQEDAISKQEKHGYQLFKSYGCVACHQGRNVGGNLFQVLGVARNYFSDYPIENDAGKGRFNVTHDQADLHKFKVPSLRLAVLTAPYFHNGSKKTLPETIRTMAKYQLGRKIPDEDLHAIITFLYTLPGKYNGRSLEPKNREQLQFITATSIQATP